MNIFQKLNAVQREVRGVGKNSYNQHQRYNYAGHEAVTEALRDAYVKHGIIRTATVVDSELDEKACYRATVDVSWVNIESPEDRHTVRMVGLAPSTSSKGPQAAATQSGVALSYAVKLAEFKVLALTGDDTPDAAGEEQTRGQEKAQTRATYNLEALLHGFRTAKTHADLTTATEAVKAVRGALTDADRATLTAARDKAVSDNGWSAGAPQGGRSQ